MPSLALLVQSSLCLHLIKSFHQMELDTDTLQILRQYKYWTCQEGTHSDRAASG